MPASGLISTKRKANVVLHDSRCAMHRGSASTAKKRLAALCSMRSRLACAPLPVERSVSFRAACTIGHENDQTVLRRPYLYEVIAQAPRRLAARHAQPFLVGRHPSGAELVLEVVPGDDVIRGGVVALPGGPTVRYARRTRRRRSSLRAGLVVLGSILLTGCGREHCVWDGVTEADEIVQVCSEFPRGSAVYCAPVESGGCPKEFAYQCHTDADGDFVDYTLTEEDCDA